MGIFSKYSWVEKVYLIDITRPYDTLSIRKTPYIFSQVSIEFLTKCNTNFLFITSDKTRLYEGSSMFATTWVDHLRNDTIRMTFESRDYKEPIKILKKEMNFGEVVLNEFTDRLTRILENLNDKVISSNDYKQYLQIVNNETVIKVTPQN
ncbi:hypothetical protein [Flammeovirga kamogawensis]|uniref:Uncharacterized protein n=1 Tax=Flammeovirga kamogawensis TaxID=373891 RepID=A0ABX8H288_9BACT|nr:hypothetical protein [Flammeovirga kamogawensis]MBB6462394.1 hypothetical protein [Flammeovirga kamogawensis]QWG09507.1 hypothetical protein KM029_23150 [Flammeovirga kamogawensis]TRX65023.1 hypothetical protein EO216_21050 [Flammeovirga kamogawensis]